MKVKVNILIMGIAIIGSLITLGFRDKLDVMVFVFGFCNMGFGAAIMFNVCNDKNDI